MALSPDIKEQLAQYLTLLEADLVLQVSLGDNEQSQKVKDFVEEIAAMSERISIENITLDRQPSFKVAKKGHDSGVVFAGLPLGHELTSFILALLQVSGRAPKVDQDVIDRIKAIDRPLHFETYVSLTCHNCPDVVQALNIMSVLNDKISHTMVEGGMFQDEVKAKGIMSVPTVFLDGEEFTSGRATIEQLLEQIAGPLSEEAFADKGLYDVLVIGGGPFANIAHGCNSVLATKLALKYGDYAVTEAGFGADLGAEKFIDIKCRMSGLRPAAVVLVATIRALKMHGGVPKADLATENVQAVVDGLPNLDKHLANIQDVYGLPVVVAINKFPLDTDAELQAVYDACDKRGVDVVISDVWANGGAGGRELAEKVVALAEQDNQFRFVYNEDDSIETKLTKIVTKIYGGKGIKLTPTAKRELAELERLGFGNYPICMAKTQYSFSDDAKKLGAPTDFIVTISNLKVSAGAGFIVALTGAIMTMPGLPKVPASETIDIDEEGNITGLF